MYLDQAAFMVEAPSGRQYVIIFQGSVNIYSIDDREWVCVVFGRGHVSSDTDRFPVPDLMLAQKFLLENDETRFQRLVFRGF
jgi:hypothetical protein